MAQVMSMWFWRQCAVNSATSRRHQRFVVMPWIRPLPCLTVSSSGLPSKMSAAVVVPSDITILEEKKKIGNRKVSFLENIGLLGMAPFMIHLHYSKLDKSDR